MSEYFFEQMRDLLGARYNDFLRAYNEKPRYKSLRVNTLKITPAEFVSLAEKLEKEGECNYGLRQNPLCPSSFYTCVKPSLDPLYHAGLYYMQEASASRAAESFSPYIGERVLDLCAAPGGKATQTAEKMKGAGVIFCNDVEKKRVTALRENIERLGVTNAVVTANTADDYVRAGFCGYFDTLVIDAPCSGGGMKRYENVTYERENVLGCAKRQREIISAAAKLVSGGGHLLYSTCTFAPEENEDNAEFICSLGFEPVETPISDFEERGIGFSAARRIYPHNFDGEGAFYCVFKKLGDEFSQKPKLKTNKKLVKAGGLNLEVALTPRGEYLLPIELPRLDGLNVAAAGVRVRDGEPTHALTHALSKDTAKAFGRVDLSATDAAKYISGFQLESSSERDGVVIAAYNGFALGRARSARDGVGRRVLKNLYPKNLRV